MLDLENWGMFDLLSMHWSKNHNQVENLSFSSEKGFVFDGRVYYISNSDQLMVTNSFGRRFSPCQRVIGFLSFGYSRFQVLMVV